MQTQTTPDCRSVPHVACVMADMLAPKQAETLQECLQRHGLTEPALQRLVTHALARVAAAPSAPDDMPAAEGISAVARYMASIGIYGPASSPFLATMYGSGEYAQAFSRLAAVKGATFVLRRGPAHIELDASESEVVGVVQVGEQRLRCRRLVGAASQLKEGAAGVTSAGQAVCRAVVVVEGVLPSLGAVEVGCTLVFPPGGDLPAMALGIVHGPGLGTCPASWCALAPLFFAIFHVFYFSHVLISHVSLHASRCFITACRCTRCYYHSRHVLHLFCAAPPQGGPRWALEPLVKLLVQGEESCVRWAAYFTHPGGVAGGPAAAEAASAKVGVAPPPDAALHLDTAAEEAARLYARLFDGARMFEGVLLFG